MLINNFKMPEILNIKKGTKEMVKNAIFLSQIFNSDF